MNEPTEQGVMTPAPDSTPDNTGPTDIEGILEERKAARETAQEPADDNAGNEPENTQDALTDENSALSDENNADQTQSDDELGDQTPEIDGEPEAVNPDEAAGGEEAQDAPIDAPHFWNADEKSVFDALPAEAKQVVAAKAKEGEAYVTRVRNDLANQVAASMRKAETEQRAKLEQLEASITYTRNAIVKSYMAMPEIKAGVLEGTISEAELFNAADQSLNAQREQITRQEQEAEQAFVARRNHELREMKSPLLDQEKAGQFLSWAQGKGIEAGDIAQTEASHLDLAYKAYLYEQGQAAFAAKPKPKPKPPSKPLRPTTKASGTTINARLKSLKAKADASGDMEDMLAYRKAKRESRAA